MIFFIYLYIPLYTLRIYKIYLYCHICTYHYLMEERICPEYESVIL